MPTGIDHVVLAVRDLERATADFTAAGFTVAPGGEHTSGGTRNALVPFQDGSYLELIAWTQPDEPRDTAWWHRLRAGEGLIDFALRTDDLDAELSRLRASGLNVPDPEAGGRTRPDGQRVEWRNLHFGEGTAPSLPFYCHSTNERSLRVAGGEAAIHENRVTGIAGVTIGVSDLAAALRDYGRLTGSPGVSGQFTLGDSGAVLIGLVELTAGDPAWDDLPIEIILATNHGPVGEIDPALTHGARLIVKGPDSVARSSPPSRSPLH